MDTWPFTHNHVIEMQGLDRATGYIYVEFRQGRESLTTTHVGVYEDEYLRVDGDWKVARRMLETKSVGSA